MTEGQKPASRQAQPIAATIVLAATAICAFAGNSLFARAALGDGAIEPGAYSAIRLASGALILLPLLGGRPGRADVRGALALALYVAGFSLAYVSLDAGTGALILFACVQATIIVFGYLRGEALKISGWIGLALAMAGLVFLIAPGEEYTAPGAAALMAIAGVAWGAYTIIGRASGDAAGRTARSFLLATPLVMPMLLLDAQPPSGYGVLLAAASGALTSGLGYVVWYRVAPHLGLATVASVQLATPVVAALGGVVLLSEPIGWRLAVGGALILAGIILTLVKTR